MAGKTELSYRGGLKVRTAWIYYVWQLPGTPVSIRLSLDVVEQLGLAVVEGFKAIPRRGLEVGGFLLGSLDKRENSTTVSIRAFEPFPSEHREGPSYVLSDNDEKNLQERIAMLVREHGEDGLVGFYRSHTRAEFRPSPHDAQLLSRYFPDSAQVFLLIRPTLSNAGTAGFFLRQDGEFQNDTTDLEFPFQVRELTTGAFPTMEEPAPQHPRPVEKPPVPRTDGLLKINASPGPRRAYRINNIRLPKAARTRYFYAGVPLIAVLVSVLVSLHRSPGHAGPPIHQAGDRPDAITLHRASDSGVAHTVRLTVSPLALGVAWEGNQFRLTWNRNAPVISAGSRGVLLIADGSRRKSWNLNKAQLTTGSFLYAPDVPASNDVDFRLEVLSGRESVRESVRFLRASPLESSETRMTGPTPAQAKRAPPVGRVSARRARAALMPRLKRNRRTIARTIPPPVNSPSREASPAPVQQAAASPQVVQASTTPAPITPPLPAATRYTPEQFSAVTAVPITDSKISRLVAKIPLVRRLRKAPQFTPPRPVYQAAISVPAELRHNVRSPVTVDLKVYVNESGRVDYAELLSDLTTTNRGLANLALYNAHQWEFEPAHDMRRNMPGQVVLHYRFGHD